MRNLIQVNLMSILFAGVLAMAVGIVWYSDAVFGKRWQRLLAVSGDKMDKSGMGKILGITFVTTLISAYILSMFMHYAGAYGTLLGAKTGLWVWLGFIMPTQLANNLFTKKPFELFLVDTGHHLTVFLVMGAVLGYQF